jgi:C-terminal processing protease CtpA/Prc
LDAGNVDQNTFVGGAAAASTGGGGTQSGDEMSSHAMSSLRQNMVSRTVVAPPGKLGIVIDTTLEGPVVHKVNPQSPLEGALFPGDIIVAIDDVDTIAMSASAIKALMVRTANPRRKLTVLSKDITN